MIQRVVVPYYARVSYYISKLYLFSLSFLFLIPGAWAGSPYCSTALKRDPFVSIDRVSGVGHRGYLGHRPEITPDTVIQAARHGIMEWAIRVFIVPDEETAAAHDALTADPLNKGVYVIAPGFVFNPETTREQAAHIFRKSTASHGLLYFDQGVKISVSPGQVAKTFRTRDLKIVDFGEALGMGLSFRGWAFPKIRGILVHQEMMGKNSIQRLRRQMARLKAEGYQFKINGDFNRALELIRNQERTKAGSDGTRQAKPTSTNRFDEELLATVLDLHLRGITSTYELWSPNGDLLAGVLVYQFGSLYNGDTVFYDDVDHAKMASIFFLETLADQGVEFADVGQVTPFTQRLGGRYVGAQEFLERIQTLEIPQLAEEETLNATRALLDWRRAISSTLGMQAHRFGTTLYYPPHAESLPGYPEISSSCKAVLLAFGGVGVNTASGRTFMGDAMIYLRHGVCVISLDYPYHANGPTDRRFDDDSVFMSSVQAMIGHYKRAGLPIYLVGHSFGPTVIQEALYLSPESARGAIYLSPGGTSTPLLQKRYRQIVESGELDAYSEGQAWEPNDKGDWWSERMEDAFRANKGVPQRTQIPVLVMAGTNDIWSTPEGLEELAGHYPNGELEVLPGVGHIIYALHGEKYSYVVERVLRFISENEDLELPRDSFARRSPISDFDYAFQNSSAFRAFIESKGKLPEVYGTSDRAAEGILTEWRLHVAEMALAIVRRELAIVRATDVASYPHEADTRAIIEKQPHEMSDNDLRLLLSAIAWWAEH